MIKAKSRLLFSLDQKRIDLISNLLVDSQHFDQECSQIQAIITSSDMTKTQLTEACNKCVDLFHAVTVTYDSFHELINDIKRYRNVIGVMEETKFARIMIMIQELNQQMATTTTSIQHCFVKDILELEKSLLELESLRIEIQDKAGNFHLDSSNNHMAQTLGPTLNLIGLGRIKNTIRYSISVYKQVFRDMLCILENNLAEYLSIGPSIICDCVKITRTDGFCDTVGVLSKRISEE